MQHKKLLLSTIAISSIMATTAFAGTWRTGADPNQNRWWYDNDNGTFANNGWQWIDGNNDGTAECYYFDADGWMLADTTTPDGYQVNENGAWVENGNVKTQSQQDTTSQQNDSLVGTYNYKYTAAYILDASTGEYNLFMKTPEHSEIIYIDELVTSGAQDDGAYSRAFEERWPLGMPWDFATRMTITENTESTFRWHGNNGNIGGSDAYDEYTKNGDNWYLSGISFNGIFVPTTDENFEVLFTDSNTLVYRYNFISYDKDMYPDGANVRIDTVYQR